MKLNCPNCGKLVTELLDCDSCQTIGCIRCVRRSNKQWLCHNCKNGIVVEKKEETSELFSMFG